MSEAKDKTQEHKRKMTKRELVNKQTHPQGETRRQRREKPWGVGDVIIISQIRRERGGIQASPQSHS